MNLRTESNAIIMELIDREAPAFRDTSGVFRRVDLAAAIDELVTHEQPFVSAEVNASARNAFFRERVDHYFRHTKDHFQRSKVPGTKELRAMIVFKDEVGAWVTKRRIDVTLAEVPFVIQYLNKMHDAFQREIDWWGDVYTQMKISDMADETPISAVVSDTQAEAA